MKHTRLKASSGFKVHQQVFLPVDSGIVLDICVPQPGTHDFHWMVLALKLCWD